MAKLQRSEHQEQAALVDWFRLQYPTYTKCLFAIPNGGNRSITEALRLKAEGVQAGVADLFLMVPNKHWHGAFIEMKSKSGCTTPLQREFLATANFLGYAGQVCRGFDEARDFITKYLNDRENNNRAKLLG